MQYNYREIPFSLNDAVIDYFSLKEEYFISAGTEVEKIKIQVAPGEYLSDCGEATDLRLSIKETVALNFQVGMGKSNLFYKLIAEYSKKDWIVIVCSPFKKLVNKDYEYLDAGLNTSSSTGPVSGKKANVCNYLQIDEQTHGESYEAANIYKVHIMTLNCFIGNPGDTGFEQRFSKAEYLDNIFGATEGKNVALFIDEIHESIHNFKIEYFPRLLKWESRIKKIFIASATFTPPVIPAINLLALLTEKRLRILEAERTKQNEQASIILNIQSEPYNKNYHSLICDIDTKIKKYKSEKRKVNIITSTKILAQRIADRCFPDQVIEDNEANTQGLTNYVNLLTGDTEVTYEKGENNIGTAFKTGIDIEETNSVLFVIFPCITERNKYKNTYGIFSDGISAIIQTVGRMRKGGIIELFIYEPEYKINNETLSLFHDKSSKQYYTANEEYMKAEEKYSEMLKGVSDEVSAMEKNLKIGEKQEDIEQVKKAFGFWYPNFHEYLLRDRRSRLLHDEPSFGKGVSSYIIWSCLNNQFLNASLSKIYYYSEIVEVIELNGSNSHAAFNSLIKRVENKLNATTFRNVIDNPDNYFSHIPNAEGQNTKIRFKCDTDSNTYAISTLLNRKREYAKQFISCLLSFYKSNGVSFENSTYINSCISEANNNNDLGKAYLELGEIKNEFIRLCRKGLVSTGNGESHYLPTKLPLGNTFTQQANDALAKIKKYDKVLKYLFHNGNLYQTLEGLFLNIDRREGSRKMIQKKCYYPVVNPIEKKEIYPGTKSILG